MEKLIRRWSCWLGMACFALALIGRIANISPSLQSSDARGTGWPSSNDRAASGDCGASSERVSGWSGLGPGAVMGSEDGYDSGAGSELDKIDPTDSSMSFSVLASSDCSSFKRGPGNSRRAGAIAISVRNLVTKIGNNEVRNAGAAVAIGTPRELSRTQSARQIIHT
jgi:hypothetical protein